MTTVPDDDAPPGSSAYITASQIASELGLHAQTVQKYFREDGLPGRKVGKEWTTTRAAFDTWLTGGPRPTRLEGTSSGIDLEVKSDG